METNFSIQFFIFRVGKSTEIVFIFIELLITKATIYERITYNTVKIHARDKFSASQLKRFAHDRNVTARRRIYFCGELFARYFESMQPILCYRFLPLDQHLHNLYLFNPHFFNFSGLWNLLFSPWAATSFKNHLLGWRGTQAGIMQEPRRHDSRKPLRYTIPRLIQHWTEFSRYFAFDRN